MLELERRLYTDKESCIEPIFLRHGEHGLTYVKGTVDASGKAFDLTGCSVFFMARLIDGSRIESKATITDAKNGCIEYAVDELLTRKTGGVHLAYFEVRKGDNTVTTNTLTITILPGE